MVKIGTFRTSAGYSRPASSFLPEVLLGFWRRSLITFKILQICPTIRWEAALKREPVVEKVQYNMILPSVTYNCPAAVITQQLWRQSP
jgi:hypothetical protein